MNILLMANQGLPRNGLVALYDAYRDVQGRNILPAGSESFALGTGWNPYGGETITISEYPTTIDGVAVMAYRIQGTGNGTNRTKWQLVVPNLSNPHTAVLAMKAKVLSGNCQISLGSGLFTEVSNEWSARSILLSNYANANAYCNITCTNVTDVIDVLVYQPQLNLLSLSPYSAHQGLPTSAQDYSGHGNLAKLGSAAGADTNDPALSGTGWIFDADGYLKSASAVFDDMAAFTCITVFKKATGSSLVSSRFFDKYKRSFYVNQSTGKIIYAQIRATNYDAGTGDTTLADGSNYVVSLMLDTPTLASKMFVNAVKQTYAVTGAGAGSAVSDAVYDLYTGNKASVDASISDAIYLQAWWNRVLSDAEYLRAYNILRRTMLQRGVTI